MFRKLFLSFMVFCFNSSLALASPSEGGLVSSSPEGLSEAVFHNNEIVLEGSVDYGKKGTLLFTSDDEYVVVLEGLTSTALPGQHIMVVGYPYKKDDCYYLSVTGYTVLDEPLLR